MNEKRKEEATVAPTQSGRKTVVVRIAGTATEAVVIRGLLESAGISSPAPTTMDPFPLRENPKGTRGVEIMVLESQAEEARRVIAEHEASAKSRRENRES
ncbi:MAG: hypothetical protein ACRD5W_13370 [Candidatus Acidiferrales bacterium]